MAQCLARLVGVAGLGSPNIELGASASVWILPNSKRNLLIVELPATALLDECCTQESPTLNNMLMRPELVQTPEPPSPERASEAGGWDVQMAEGKGEGNMRVVKGTGSVLCAWPAKGWQTVTLKGSGHGSAPAGNEGSTAAGRP